MGQPKQGGYDAMVCWSVQIPRDASEVADSMMTLIVQ